MLLSVMRMTTGRFKNVVHSNLYFMIIRLQILVYIHARNKYFISDILYACVLVFRNMFWISLYL